MGNVRLKEFRIERDEESAQSFALFELTESPTASWIVQFEECLAKHTAIAVVVSDRLVRTDLPTSRAVPRLIQIVQRCIDETNVLGAC